MTGAGGIPFLFCCIVIGLLPVTTGAHVTATGPPSYR